MVTLAQAPADVTDLAANHPWTALGILVISGLFASAPSLLGRMKAKPEPPPAALPAAAAQVDANAELVKQLVAGLEDRANKSDQRYADLERRHYSEVNELKEQLRDARSKIMFLESEVERLQRWRISGGGLGG